MFITEMLRKGVNIISGGLWLLTWLMYISVTVWTWSHHFPLQNGGWLEYSLQHLAQSDYLYSGGQAHAQTFPPKVDMTSSEHHVGTYWWCGAFGWWHLHHNYIRLGGLKGQMHGGRDSQFRDFRCRAYRAKLIPSRVLRCVPTLDQQGILYLISTKTELTEKAWLASSCNLNVVFFLDLVALVAIKPIGPANVLYWSWQRLKEEWSGSSWSPTLSYHEVVTDLWHPQMGSTKSVIGSLNVIIKKAYKSMIDLVISRKADGEIPCSPAINCH